MSSSLARKFEASAPRASSSSSCPASGWVFFLLFICTLHHGQEFGIRSHFWFLLKREHRLAGCSASPALVEDACFDGSYRSLLTQEVRDKCRPGGIWADVVRRRLRWGSMTCVRRRRAGVAGERRSRIWRWRWWWRENRSWVALGYVEGSKLCCRVMGWRDVHDWTCSFRGSYWCWGEKWASCSVYDSGLFSHHLICFSIALRTVSILGFFIVCSIGFSFIFIFTSSVHNRRVTVTSKSNLILHMPCVVFWKLLILSLTGRKCLSWLLSSATSSRVTSLASSMSLPVLWILPADHVRPVLKFLWFNSLSWSSVKCRLSMSVDFQKMNHYILRCLQSPPPTLQMWKRSLSGLRRLKSWTPLELELAWSWAAMIWTLGSCLLQLLLWQTGTSAEVCNGRIT